MARKTKQSSFLSKGVAASGLLTARNVLLPSISKLLPRVVAPILTGSSSRPLWFDGRFLAAQDMVTEQDYFLQRQMSLGREAGSGVVHGLWVDQGAILSQSADPETIVVYAGVGITPSGALVDISTDLTIKLSDLPAEENLDVEFGLSQAPRQPARTRTGIYILALRPVEFTANPIAFYPATLQSPRTTRDGDTVEATAVSLIPYINPVNAFDASVQRAALARQIFVSPASLGLPDSLLPLAMVSIDRDTIQWIDPYLVRRDSSPPPQGVPRASADRATQQAFLLQYDAMLQAAVTDHTKKKSNARFAASDYLQALPPAARFPIGGVDFSAFSQTFFPPQMKVQLGIIPEDELPALLEESLSLSPIDLTLPAPSFANTSVFAFVAVPRSSFAALQNTLTPVPLTPALPQLLLNRSPLRILTDLQQRLKLTSAASPSSADWQSAVAGQTFGFYIVQRSQPLFPDFISPQPAADATVAVDTLIAPAAIDKSAVARTAAIKVAPKPSAAAAKANATTTPRPATTRVPLTTTTPQPSKTKVPATTTTPAPKRTATGGTTIAPSTTASKPTTTPGS